MVEESHEERSRHDWKCRLIVYGGLMFSVGYYYTCYLAFQMIMMGGAR